MLIIRKEQMEALDAYMLQSFKRRLADHLTAVLPARAATLGPEGVAVVIDQGIENAKRLGIVAERDVARYIDLQAGLERSDDVGGAKSWPGTILSDTSRSSEERLTQVYAELSQRFPKCTELAAWWDEKA